MEKSLALPKHHLDTKQETFKKTTLTIKIISYLLSVVSITNRDNLKQKNYLKTF